MVIEEIIKLENKANDFGFSWPNLQMIIDQITSECEEIKQELDNDERLQEEVGDLMHAVFSLCVYLKLDPQLVLQKTAHKFDNRLSKVIELAQEQGYKDLQGQDIQVIMEFWNKSKLLTD